MKLLLWRSSDGSVAQVCNLPYRRIAFCGLCAGPERQHIRGPFKGWLDKASGSVGCVLAPAPERARPRAQHAPVFLRCRSGLRLVPLRMLLRPRTGALRGQRQDAPGARPITKRRYGSAKNCATVLLVPALRVWVSVILAALTLGCRRDMFQQPRDNPLSASDFFRDGAGSRAPVPHTVARGHLNEDEQYYTGKAGTNLVTTFPFPVTRAVLERGRERFEIYCAPCHGREGDGRGMIPQRGFPSPPSYHIERLRQAPVGHFYDVMSQGYGVMYSQAPRVEPADRWAIAAYIRALQLSHDARIADVPADERARLEGQKL